MSAACEEREELDVLQYLPDWTEWRLLLHLSIQHAPWAGHSASEAQPLQSEIEFRLHHPHDTWPMVRNTLVQHCMQPVELVTKRA